jgi:16S rRNA (cytidine1402-2'-O)-methyltransferase
MTKMFEEYWRGGMSGALEHFKSQPARGEFTLVIEGKKKEERGIWTEATLMAAIKKGLKAGEAPSELAGRLAKESGWKRREVYKLVTS